MSYNIVDLLKKLEKIESNAFSMYNSIASIKEENNLQLVTVAKILASEEAKHVELYRKLIKKAKLHDDTEIDFGIYDKASSLVEEFKKRITNPQVQSVQELVRFALDFEGENSALLIDIRGRMVMSEDDSVDFIYLTLSELILEEQKHAGALKAFIK